MPYGKKIGTNCVGHFYVIQNSLEPSKKELYGSLFDNASTLSPYAVNGQFVLEYKKLLQWLGELLLEFRELLVWQGELLRDFRKLLL